ncbi:MAG: hypothetical protein Q8P67_12050 [archaeon]|nr:hypothetical protein [archaeon]
MSHLCSPRRPPSPPPSPPLSSGSANDRQRRLGAIAEAAHLLLLPLPSTQDAPPRQKKSRTRSRSSRRSASPGSKTSPSPRSKSPSSSSSPVPPLDPSTAPSTSSSRASRRCITPSPRSSPVCPTAGLSPRPHASPQSPSSPPQIALAASPSPHASPMPLSASQDSQPSGDRRRRARSKPPTSSERSPSQSPPPSSKTPPPISLQSPPPLVPTVSAIFRQRDAEGRQRRQQEIDGLRQWLASAIAMRTVAHPPVADRPFAHRPVIARPSSPSPCSIWTPLSPTHDSHQSSPIQSRPIITNNHIILHNNNKQQAIFHEQSIDNTAEPGLRERDRSFSQVLTSQPDHDPILEPQNDDGDDEENEEDVVVVDDVLVNDDDDDGNIDDNPSAITCSSKSHLAPPPFSGMKDLPGSALGYPLAPLTIARRTDMRMEFSPQDPLYPERHHSFRMVFGARAVNPSAPQPPRLVIRGRYAKGELTFVREVFKGLGFVEVHRESPFFQAAWVIRFSPEEFQKMTASQKVNFMPGTACLCRKDRLHETLTQAMRRFHPDDFAFWPRGFCLPAEYPLLQAHWQRQGISSEAWILKPPLSSCGRRIRLFTSLEQVDPADEWMAKNIPLAQRYIANPVLVDGFKCTLRVYAAITAVDPLRVYVYPEGLVRICSQRYSTELDSFEDVFSHLDSIDINEARTEAFHEAVDPSVPNREGLRMLITDWARWQQQQIGLNPQALWRNIHEVVVKSILAAEPAISRAVKGLVKKRFNCFDLFGYDILVDQAHKCWLLEINHTPSMSQHTQLENRVKLDLLSSLFRLVDYPASDLARVGALTARRWPHLVQLQYLQRRALDASHLLPPGFRLVQQLTWEHLWIIIDRELELLRSAPWVPVFPALDTCERYQPFMLKNNNAVLVDWVQSEFHSTQLELMAQQLMDQISPK